MLKSRSLASFVAGITTAAALLLVVDRGGVLAWVALAIGIALIAKIWFKPSRIDVGLGVGLAVVSAAAWIGTFYYVISTWESGEVVELVIDASDGTHTARVWVLDMDEQPLVYYDAEPEVARSLLEGTPVQFTRAGKLSTRIPEAARVDSLPDDEANRIFDAMIAKYGDRVGAADIYYSMLGRSRDRVAVVARLIQE